MEDAKFRARAQGTMVVCKMRPRRVQDFHLSARHVDIGMVDELRGV